MKFPISVLFLDKKRKGSVKIRAAMPRWRSGGLWGPFPVLELPSGTAGPREQPPAISWNSKRTTADVPYREPEVARRCPIGKGTMPGRMTTLVAAGMLCLPLVQEVSSDASDGQIADYGAAGGSRPRSSLAHDTQSCGGVPPGKQLHSRLRTSFERR